MATEMLTETTPDSLLDLSSPSDGLERDLTDSERPGRPLPEWFTGTARKVLALTGLPTDWDSYGGEPLRSDVALYAIELLALLCASSPWIPRPDVIPTSRGHVAFEWSKARGALEIEVRGFRRGSFFFDLYDTGEEATESEFRSIEPVNEQIQRLFPDTDR